MLDNLFNLKYLIVFFKVSKRVYVKITMGAKFFIKFKFDTI